MNFLKYLSHFAKTTVFVTVTNGTNGLSRGVVGGIAVGIIVFFVATGALAFVFLLPKAAGNPNTASANLQNGRGAITEYPKDRTIEHSARLSPSA